MGIRSDILTVARTHFSQFGYFATTFQGVADEVGVSRASINYYFSGKEELYREVVAQADKQLSVLVDGLNSASRGSAVRAELIDVFTALTSPPKESMAAFLLSSIYDGYRQPCLPTPNLGIIRTHLENVLGRGAEHGELDTAADVTSLAELLLTVLCSVSFRALASEDLDFPKTLAAAISTVLG